jgi:hypothetical protein
MTESQVRSLFNHIAEDGADTSGVDTQLALRRGRKRLRWRRARLAGTPMVAAAVVAVVALAVAASLGRTGGQAAAGGGGPAAPRAFSPLIPGVAFGWLPAGQSFGSGGVRPQESYLDAGPGGASGWSLGVYARGQCRLTGSASRLNCPGSALRISKRAPGVAGHLAFWTGPAPGIAWQYARGGWAQMTIPTASLSDALRGKAHLAATALKIARHVRLGLRTPLAFAARFPGLPRQWQVHNISFYVPAGLLRADQYMLASARSRFHGTGGLHVWTDAPYIIVKPTPRGATCSPHDPHSQTTSEIINGYHVVLKRYHIGGLPVQELCATHARGLYTDIRIFGAHPSTDPASLFKNHMQLLGTNPANWTTNPLG